MKTAMQELIEMFESDFNLVQSKRKDKDSVMLIIEASTLSHVITNLKSKLEVEKKQIIEAYEKGNHSEMRGGKFLRPVSEEYYNQKYNQNK